MTPIGPRKILHVFGRMNRGGAELRTLDVIRQLAPRHYTSHFAVLSGLPGTLDEEIRSLGGTVHYCRLKSPLFAPRFLRLLRAGRFDVVHSHVHYASGAIAALAAVSRVRTRVVHFRSSTDGREDGPVRNVVRGMLRDAIDRYATHIVGVSEAAMDGTWKADWRADARSRVIYNGLPDTGPEGSPAFVRHALGVPLDAPLVVHVGRMHEAKNHLRVVSVFAHLARRHPEARLVLVGRSQRRIEETLHAHIEQWGLAGRVILTGERTDVASILAAADALLFPSLWEGLPGAVLEALRAGTPVVASALPVMLEIGATLPWVSAVDLRLPDDLWADAVWSAIQRGRNPRERAAATVAFRDSPFGVRHAAAQLMTLWSGRDLELA